MSTSTFMMIYYPVGFACVGVLLWNWKKLALKHKAQFFSFTMFDLYRAFFRGVEHADDEDVLLLRVMRISMMTPFAMFLFFSGMLGGFVTGIFFLIIFAAFRVILKPLKNRQAEE